MKVILKQTVPNVGKEWTLVTVKDGFARNYLFPRGLAILADKSQVKALERRNSRVAGKLEETRSGAVQLKSDLDGKSVRLEGKVGHDSTKLFGAITAQDIADAIADQLGVKVEKRTVALVEPIKRLGRHQVHLDLHRDVDAFIDVVVFDPAHPYAFDPVVEDAPVAGEEEA